MHLFLNGLRNDAMLLIIRLLKAAAAVGFRNRPIHAFCHDIGIHNDAPLGISCRTPNGLNQRGFGTQEALLICIQNGNQTDLGDIQTLTQKVDADQHIKDIHTQITNDFQTLQCINIRMEIAHAHPCFTQVIRQAFCHFFRQGCHKNLIACLCGFSDLGKQIINLPMNGTNGNFGVQQACRTNNLLCRLLRMLLFINRGGCGNE